ncbi:MAG: amidohydrolase family protein [Verrucomicrobiales bacterium]|jgi:cytosine/adenosine deaminase-related metal-dependent hydrolase|nr:amidohydrolase family protein [Verrucomicrobiales bacterium]
MLIRPAMTLTMTGPPLAGAAVRVSGNRIAAVGAGLTPAAGETVLDLPGCVLLPGLINAHCHLDYTNLQGAIPPGLPFTEWLKHMHARKRRGTVGDWLAAIARGGQLLVDSGCTTVVNIAALPEVLPRLPRPPLRTWWCVELIDARSRAAADEALTLALEFFARSRAWPGGCGLSPHAPYTASAWLYRRALRLARREGLLLTTHVAESDEEQEMFAHRRGALFEFFRGAGRDMGDCGQDSALARLLADGLLDAQCLVAHLNHVSARDELLLRQQPLPVVHCPRCHAYFGRARFPYERLRATGCSVSLGTDSLASNDVLDLRAELRAFRRAHPAVSAEEGLRMVTTVPAAQLGQAGALGVIAGGALADLVAFPLPAGADPYLAVTAARGRPALFMVDGARGG